jgi:hypothetical protein
MNTQKLVSASGEVAGYIYNGIKIRRTVVKARTRRTSERSWKIAKRDIYGINFIANGIHDFSFRTLAEAKDFVDAQVTA